MRLQLRPARRGRNAWCDSAETNHRTDDLCIDALHTNNGADYRNHQAEKANIPTFRTLLMQNYGM
jgi:hypothetical protein